MKKFTRIFCIIFIKTVNIFYSLIFLKLKGIFWSYKMLQIYNSNVIEYSTFISKANTCFKYYYFKLYLVVVLRVF
jgi:hypothetical protein